MVNWLYLDLNSFFASCEQQDNPRLRGKPIAVVPMMADSTAILAASYPAKAFGIKTGTRVSDAKKMCPGLNLVVADHQKYIRYHHLVIEAVESCLPVHSVCSIDEIACELSGSHKEIARAKEICWRIKKTLIEKVGVSMTASIGLAPNKYLAKVAADMMKPDGLTIILKSELPDRLKSLHLRDLPGIGPKIETRLWAKGIRTMEDLLARSEQQLREVWGGIWGARMYRLIRGETIELSNRSGLSMGHEHVLPPKQRNHQDSFFVALKLLSKAAQRVRSEGKLTRRLTVAVRFLSGQRLEDHFSFENTQDTTRLAKYLNHFWKNMPPRERPIKVSLSLSDLVSAEHEQLSLFENPKKAELFKCVDQINSKFGGQTVFIASLLDQNMSAPTRIAFQRIPGLKEFE